MTLQQLHEIKDGSVLETAKHVDLAPENVDYSGATAKTDPKEIALVRKLDWWIMPILWLMYWLNYLVRLLWAYPLRCELTFMFQDRNAIALARLNTLEEDLGLTPQQYQTCVAILFAGYVFVGIPANMVVTRVKPSIWMSSCMTVWAIISCLTAVSRNYTGLLLTRFFLGITEAPYYPGALYILATFYTRKELATRISILYTGNILATAFAGLIALGVFEMHGMVCCS